MFVTRTRILVSCSDCSLHILLWGGTPASTPELQAEADGGVGRSPGGPPHLGEFSTNF
jgi:hypothetical protein